MPPPRISIVVASVRAATLGHTVAALQRQDLTDWELIIVTQGSDASLGEVVDKLAAGDSRIRSIHSDRKGLSIARNIGMAAAGSDIVAMTDDDCEPRADWLTTAVTAFQADPDLGLLTGSLLAPPADGAG